AGIACNMVAGHHHDHAFVPARHADRAIQFLRALADG
ncbi:MAG: acetyltransferase, partial [Pseudomonadota bacterium]